MSGATEDTIRTLIKTRGDAVARGDVDAIISQIAKDVSEFDMIGPLHSKGKATLLENLKDWLDLYETPPKWEDRDVTVVVDGDVAFAHSLGHVTGKRKDGVVVDMWFRTTLGLSRLNSEWWIVHVHQSEPFDIESGKASLGLKP